MNKSFDPTQDKFKVSLYIRVSTGKQVEGDSLEEQENELKKFCEYKNYLIHKTHIERGRSAKDTKRPEYQKLLAAIKEKKINAVIVKKLDRLSRSLLDFEEFMRIAQENNVEFISLKENFDTTNAMGKAMLRVALVFAQLEREQLSERVSDVMTYRASQGLYNGGNVPYGYYILDKELIPNKQEKKIVEIVFNKFIDLKSTTLVAQELNALGFRNRNRMFWDSRRVHDILRKVVYAGNLIWNGDVYNGNHQPIITDNCFNKAQKIFNERKKLINRSKIGGILKGFIYCGYCTANLTPTYTKKKNGQIYYYYRCVNSLNPLTSQKHKCKVKYYSMQQLEKNVFDKILEYSSEDKLNSLKHTIEKHNQIIEKELLVLRKELLLLNKKRETIKTKKEKYLDSLVANEHGAREKKLINEKIEEFSLEEKQLTALVYQQKFNISNKSELLQSIDEFKEQMIFLKINYPSIDQKELNKWLNKNIESIIYTKEEIKINFKLLNIS